MKKIGILTSGGDCQSLNATMRAVVMGLYKNVKDVEIYGMIDGYKGLIYGNYKKMKKDDFKGILNKGGTILGTSRQPFKLMGEPGEGGIDKVKGMKDTYKKLKLDALVILGGNGTHKTANLLRTQGLNVVTLPKTIDNDIWGTDMTFGFQSAVDVATNAIDCIRTTAESHSRVFVVEVMGHKVGWMTLYAGIAGGADVILLPEIPYDPDEVIDVIQKREKAGEKCTIIACAEGAITKNDAALTKKEYKAKYKGGAPASSTLLGNIILEKTGKEVRTTVPGHMQRGGNPCAYDRVLSTRLGSVAAKLIAEEKYGYMVSVQGNEIVPVPLEEVAGKLKYVSTDCEVITQAKNIGISFGD